MAYDSAYKLQKTLETKVFNYAKDAKIAAEKALKILVEIITFYLLKTWEFNDNISIDYSLPEYGNPDITHKVDYALLPIINEKIITIPKKIDFISPNFLLKELQKNDFDIEKFDFTKNQLLSRTKILRNACVIGHSTNSNLLAGFEKINEHTYDIRIYEQLLKPYAMIECKRVGVEEGMKKDPQTIQKAKQGAYVPRAVSSLQKIKDENGELKGIIYKSDNYYYIDDYSMLHKKIIKSDDKELLRKFVLTIGVVSNHGNWFTFNNPDKELKILAQSYDWILFLSDKGLAEFIEIFIQKPIEKYRIIRDAFSNSYAAVKKKNQFTKVQMNFESDAILLDYFENNLYLIEKWFNIISPANSNIDILKEQLVSLKNKPWNMIL
ncbi:MAG: hypothetical protein HW421_704 [Ignavibacteria bacterium]|nr:hypothetical protein [Ignavibacteria bacterium]